MPQAWSAKRERQYEYVKDSEQEKGESADRAEEIAARTVNKQRARAGEAKSGGSHSKSKSSASKRKSSGTKTRSSKTRSSKTRSAQLKDEVDWNTQQERCTEFVGVEESEFEDAQFEDAQFEDTQFKDEVEYVALQGERLEEQNVQDLFAEPRLCADVERVALTQELTLRRKRRVDPARVARSWRA